MKKMLLVMCALSASVALAEPAFARKKRHLEGVAKGSHGHERKITRDVEGGDGVRTTRTSVKGENGRSVTQDKNLNIDREAGLAERSKTLTSPYGDTRTVDVTATKTDDGQDDLYREVAGFNGDTRTKTGSGTFKKTGNG